jgi:magnesium transporter
MSKKRAPAFKLEIEEDDGTSAAPAVPSRPMRIECLRYHPGGYTVNAKLPMLFEHVVLAEELNPTEAAEGIPLPSADPDPRRLEQAAQPLPSVAKPVSWINIENPAAEGMARLTELYGIHPQVIDDLVAPLPRPRLEEYTNAIYLTLQLPSFRHGEPGRQALALVLGSGYVLSFLPADSAIRQTVREAIAEDRGRIRQLGADYLLISLLNEALERSFPVIELMESGVEDLESEIIEQPSHENLEQILETKRAITSLRHYVWPSAEVITSLSRLRSNLVNPKMRVFLRDSAEHAMHLTNLVNTLRDMVAGLLDIYHSASSASLNKVMKVLTMISTIFIPLTFLAGVEGMNIHDMPELGWDFTYPVLLCAMLLVAGGMLVFFKRKKWF